MTCLVAARRFDQAPPRAFPPRALRKSWYDERRSAAPADEHTKIVDVLPIRAIHVTQEEGVSEVPLPIMIDVTGGGVAAPSAAAMIEACNASAGRTCEIVESTPTDSDAVAHVAWKGSERLQAVVQVGLGRGDHRRWNEREIEFKPTDDVAERWRSIGLIIGATATAETPDPPALDKSTPPDTVSSVGAAPKDRTGKGTFSHFWLDAGGVGGPALDDGRWRAGVWIGGAWAPSKLPVAMVASVRYERRFSTGDFELSMGSGSLGVLGFLDFGPVALEGRVEVMRRILVLSAADEATGVSETRHRWETGVRAGGDWVVPLRASRLSIVVGADLTYAWEGSEIAVRRQAVGHLPKVVGSAVVGLRWSLEAPH